MKEKTMAWLRFLPYLLVLTLPFVTAMAVRADTVPLNATMTAEEKAHFNEILTPVMKIYNFIKYSASVIAVIALLFAGISYMMSGNDIRQRDVSKNMAAYVLIGLVIIWAAPFVVNMLIA